jgi:hypothetical protein
MQKHIYSLAYSPLGDPGFYEYIIIIYLGLEKSISAAPTQRSQPWYAYAGLNSLVGIVCIMYASNTYQIYIQTCLMQTFFFFLDVTQKKRKEKYLEIYASNTNHCSRSIIKVYKKKHW